MQSYVLAFPERKWENYLLSINEEPMIRIVERRLLTSKRIDEVIMLIRKNELKKFSLHASNLKPLDAKNKLEALYKALPSSGEVFLVEGNMPLIMPFLVNYLSMMFHELEYEALIPGWADGTLEVTHAFYDSKALKNAIEVCLLENERKLSCIAVHLDYKKISIEELSRRNPKVTLSFFKVRTVFDVKFAEENLKNGL